MSNFETLVNVLGFPRDLAEEAVKRFSDIERQASWISSEVDHRENERRGKTFHEPTPVPSPSQSSTHSSPPVPSPSQSSAHSSPPVPSPSQSSAHPAPPVPSPTHSSPPAPPPVSTDRKELPKITITEYKPVDQREIDGLRDSLSVWPNKQEILRECANNMTSEEKAEIFACADDIAHAYGLSADDIRGLFGSSNNAKKKKARGININKLVASRGKK